MTGSKEASELLDKLPAEMMLEIESQVRTSGHVLSARTGSVSLPFVSADSRSRSNKRAVGAHERRGTVSLSFADSLNTEHVHGGVEPNEAQDAFSAPNPRRLQKQQQAEPASAPRFGRGSQVGPGDRCI